MICPLIKGLCAGQGLSKDGSLPKVHWRLNVDRVNKEFCTRNQFMRLQSLHREKPLFHGIVIV